MAYSATSQQHVPFLERPGSWVYRVLILLVLVYAISSTIIFQLEKSYSFNWGLALKFLPLFNEGLLLTVKASLFASCSLLVMVDSFLAWSAGRGSDAELPRDC